MLFIELKSLYDMMYNNFISKQLFEEASYEKDCYYDAVNNEWIEEMKPVIKAIFY